MVRPGLLDWRGVARVMSERPAEIVGLDDQGRPIEWESRPTWCSSIPTHEWTVHGPELASVANNTPYESMTLPAKVTATVLRGRVNRPRRQGAATRRGT